MHDDLPLFAWQPPRKLIPFPMAKRIGRIRDVAQRLLDKRTNRSATHYRKQVTDALIASFDRIGVPETEQDEQLGVFWSAVEVEMGRQCHDWANNGGGAA